MGLQVVCKVTSARGTEGTGFFGRLLNQETGEFRQELFTNNHVSNEQDLAAGDNLSVDVQFWIMRTHLPSLMVVSRFTCSLLDVTFVELSGNGLEMLASVGCKFLTLSKNHITVGDPLFILQLANGDAKNQKQANLAMGSVHQLHGFNFFHKVVDYAVHGFTHIWLRWNGCRNTEETIFSTAIVCCH